MGFHRLWVDTSAVVGLEAHVSFQVQLRLYTLAFHSLPPCFLVYTAKKETCAWTTMELQCVPICPKSGQLGGRIAGLLWCIPVGKSARNSDSSQNMPAQLMNKIGHKVIIQS